MLGKSKHHLLKVVSILMAIVVSVLSVFPAAASVDPYLNYTFAGPVFGLDTAPDGSLLAADSGAGVVSLRKDSGSLIAELPNASDVDSIGRSNMFAITGGGGGETDAKLYRVSKGKVRMIADLAAFEAEVNPHKANIDSNPFDVEALTGGKALVADAGGNDLLIVNQKGKVDWIAVLPDELVSTQNLKNLVGCPNPPVPDLNFACGLPDMMPAEPVATSVAVGPDGAYYVSELKGFPFAPGTSRIWRIEPGTLHADCATSPACTIVASGFTSIVDIKFGPDSTLYVVEMDEASAAAVELVAFFGLPSATLGGTVNACNSSTWSCTEIATGLNMPTAVTVGKDGTVYAVVNALIPGAVQVVPLP